MPPGIRPVTHLFLSEVTSDSVLVAWSAPAPPADLFILSYSSSDGTDTSKVTLDGSKTASLIQGLLPSTPYAVSLITIQADVTSEPITASLTTGETRRKTHVRTWKSLVKGSDGEKVQDASLVKVQFCNPPTGARVIVVTLCSRTSTFTVSCLCVFHTSAPVSHRIDFTYSAVSTMSGDIWGEVRKKGENLNANANRCLIQHTVCREILTFLSFSTILQWNSPRQSFTPSSLFTRPHIAVIPH